MIPAGPGAFVSVLKAGNTFVEVHIGQEKEPSIDRKWLLEGHRDFTFNGDEVDNLDADVRIVTDPAGIKGTLFGDDTKGLFLVDFDQRKKFTVYWNGTSPSRTSPPSSGAPRKSRASGKRTARNTST